MVFSCDEHKGLKNPSVCEFEWQHWVKISICVIPHVTLALSSEVGWDSWIRDLYECQHAWLSVAKLRGIHYQGWQTLLTNMAEKYELPSPLLCGVDCPLSTIHVIISVTGTFKLGDVGQKACLCSNCKARDERREKVIMWKMHSSQKRKWKRNKHGSKQAETACKVNNRSADKVP